MLSVVLAQIMQPKTEIVFRPDSWFSRQIKVTDQRSYVLTGTYEKTRITLENIERLKIVDLNLVDCDVRIAGCQRHVAQRVTMRGGAWNVFPASRMSIAATNSPRWIGDNISIPGLPAQRWSRVWPGGSGLVSVTFPLEHVKALGEEYSTNVWKLRDSAGNEFLATLHSWVPDRDRKTITATLNPNGTMARGRGFWNTYLPDRFLKSLFYADFDVAGHEQMSFYFCDGILFTNSRFGAATVDYNLGFENCANVVLNGLRSSGNRTIQGGKSSLSFLFGIRGLRILESEIETAVIQSGGWEVSRVDSSTQIDFWDWEKGWFRDIRVKGILLPY